MVVHVIEFAIALQYAESMLDTVGNAKFTHCLQCWYWSNIEVDTHAVTMLHTMYHLFEIKPTDRDQPFDP